ncbi:L,D-transpeptidase [Carboxydochorda subterranea]|uniref:L,D-transpeptidase n=1 Tax=Carboxydichorda subterranea TaxID=3109565 RepID=A0ABZ1BT60_9FIRM|nr:L,D-transpeptidase [Limnochorda sp. L945t]WRP16017.1 L,D-transpeptidase [Limnochorda sp. L945t]
MGPRVRVSLRERAATVWPDDAGPVTFSVGVGRPASPTPVGQWHVIERRQEVAGGTVVDVFVLDAPGHICLRGHPDLASLGRASSGG